MFLPSPARVLLLDESKEIHSSFMLQCLSLDVTSATRGVRIPAVLHPARTDVADVSPVPETGIPLLMAPPIAEEEDATAAAAVVNKVSFRTMAELRRRENP